MLTVSPQSQLGINKIWINSAPLGEYAVPLIEVLKENDSMIALLLGIALGVHLRPYAATIIQTLNEKKRIALDLYLGGFVSPLVKPLKEKERRGIAGKDVNSCLVLGGESSHITKSQAGIWIMDSGAQGHATGDLQHFSGELNWAKQGNWVYGVSGKKLPILASGTVQFRDFKLEEVYYVEGLGRNLICLSKFLDTCGYEIAIGKAAVIKEEATGRQICELRLVDRLYELDSVPIGL